jgi:hypothetical protein
MRAQIKRRAAGKENAIVRSLEHGVVGLMVLDSVRRLMPPVTAKAVVEDLFERHEDLLDLSQTLTALRRFAVADPESVIETGLVESEVGGRAMIGFEITAAGRASLENGLEHLERVLEALRERQEQEHAPETMREAEG